MIYLIALLLISYLFGTGVLIESVKAFIKLQPPSMPQARQGEEEQAQQWYNEELHKYQQKMFKNYLRSILIFITSPFSMWVIIGMKMV